MFTRESQSGLRMLVLAALAVIFMVVDKQTTAFQHIRLALAVPIAPLQYLVSWPIQLADQVGGLMSSHDALVKENLSLKSEQLLLKAQVQQLLAIESENHQLKALLSRATQVRGKVLIAQLLAIDTDPFVHQVMINKGSGDHLYVGQPVLDANGVMGQVIEVGPFTSRVLLVNDPHSGVPVQVARNGIRSIAVGDSYSGKLRLANVPQTADIQLGDILVTSGLGENYPEGYPLGRVSAVERDPGLQFATLMVEPDAKLDRSRQVLLVWPSQTIHQASQPT